MSNLKADKTKVISTFFYHFSMKYYDWLKNIKGYSDKTIEVYGKYIFELQVIGEDWEALICRYESRSNSTKRLILSAVKSYFVYKGDERASKIELPKKNLVVSDHVTYEDYKKYLQAINKRNKTGFQKYLIVRLLFETGIRSSELLWITRSNIFGNKIKIKGKGNKERFVNISNWLRTELEEYLLTIKTERLFDFGYKNLYSKIQRMDKTRILRPHMFRHGFAKHCYNSGISIYDISLSMGHSSIDTTSKYINKKSEDVKIHTIF